MKYEIITLDEKNHSRIVWGTFNFSTDSKSNEKIVSFLGYLKSSSSHFDEFLLYEVETDRAIPLHFIFDSVVSKLISA